MTLHEGYPLTFAWVKATAIGVAACVGAASATFGVVKVWLDERYVRVAEPIATVHQAELLESKLRTEFKTDLTAIWTEVGKVNAKLRQIDRQSAGLLTQALDTRVVMSRNRVNDCNIKRSDKKYVMSGIEAAACSQYDGDWQEAVRRYQKQADEAQQTYRRVE